MNQAYITNVLTRHNIKYWKIDMYQNRVIIHIPETTSNTYVTIVSDITQIPFIKEKIHVKMDLSLVMKLWLTITGQSYTIKDYKGGKK